MTISRELFYSLDQVQNAAIETQDPNPLHRQSEVQLLCVNPVSSPIVLGFQIATLIDTEVSRLDVGNDCSNSGKFGAGYASSYSDIRYLRPAHPYEIMHIGVKVASNSASDQSLAKLQKTGRFKLSGESGAVASGLRRTSDQEIDLPNAFAGCGLKCSDSTRTQKNPMGLYQQQEKIHLQAGCRFLEASLGTNLDSGVPCSNTTPNTGEAGKPDIASMPKMYPVALSSKVLANSGTLADIDLNETLVVYSRIKLRINNLVCDNIGDGDILDYMVINNDHPETQYGKSQSKRVVHVLACTKNRQLVFWGTFTLSLVSSMSQHDSPALNHPHSKKGIEEARKENPVNFNVASSLI